MQPFPHIYTVKVSGDSQSNLNVTCNDLPPLTVNAPATFGGPGDQWSPEELLMASVANCFVLSFRAITQISKFDWLEISCESTGQLNKVDRKIKFTHIETKVVLTIDSEEKREKAEKLLNKTEDNCLINNSLNCETQVHITVVVK